MSVELMSLVMKADLGTVIFVIPAHEARNSQTGRLVMRPEVTGRLGTLDKHLLLVLADRGNPDGRSIYPSVEWMAKAMGAQERGVRYSLRRLKHTIPRILVVEKEKAGRYSTLHYRIMVPALERVAQWKLRVDEEAGVHVVHPSASRGARSSARAALSSARAALSAAEPSDEPSVEPPQSKTNHQKTESTSKTPAAEKPAAGALSKRLIFDDPKHQATADRVHASFRVSGSSRARAVTASQLAAMPAEE